MIKEANFVTHVNRQQGEQRTQMGVICQLLDITAEHYCWHQFQEYEMFLQEMYGNSPMYLNIMRYSPIFRGFWNNEWACRNEDDFLPFAYDVKFDSAESILEYRHIHDHRSLLCNDGFIHRCESIFKMAVKKS